MIKKYWKVRDYCHYTGKLRSTVHSICNLRYSIPKEIPLAIQNGLNHDFRFIVTDQAKEFEGEFSFLGENT